MLTAITAAHILTPEEEIDGGAVLIEDARILDVIPRTQVPESAAAIHLPEATLTPGFIDVHVHGGNGVSLAGGDADEIRSYARWVATKGVTSFLASIVTGTPEEGEAALRAVADAAGPLEGGATLAGAHLEGPFVSPTRRGALPESWIRPPDIALLRRFIQAADGQVRVLTLAPELAGADAVLTEAIGAGCLVAVGHTDATYEQARAAFAAGACHITHAFNAMRTLHHREPGPLGAALDSNTATVELIADGVHVHPAAARLLLRARGTANVVLVTDGVPAAGQPDGAYRLGDLDVTLRAGRVTLADGTIAGSAATMDSVVANVVRFGLASLADAVAMASTVPARVLGMGSRKGRIAAGYDADLVALAPDMAVAAAVVGGRVAYSRPAVPRS